MVRAENALEGIAVQTPCDAVCGVWPVAIAAGVPRCCLVAVECRARRVLHGVLFLSSAHLLEISTPLRYAFVTSKRRPATLGHLFFFQTRSSLLVVDPRGLCTV